jgi:hypothetical protein
VLDKWHSVQHFTKDFLLCTEKSVLRLRLKKLDSKAIKSTKRTIKALQNKENYNMIFGPEGVVL